MNPIEVTPPKKLPPIFNTEYHIANLKAGLIAICSAHDKRKIKRGLLKIHAAHLALSHGLDKHTEKKNRLKLYNGKII